MGLQKGQLKGAFNIEGVDPAYLLVGAMVRQAVSDIVEHHRRCNKGHLYNMPWGGQAQSECSYDVESAREFLFRGGLFKLLKFCQVDVEPQGLRDKIKAFLKEKLRGGQNG